MVTAAQLKSPENHTSLTAICPPIGESPGYGEGFCFFYMAKLHAPWALDVSVMLNVFCGFIV